MPRKVHPHKVFHWPMGSGEHNFVQVRLDYHEPGFREYPMLAFPHNGDSHGQVLGRFLREVGIEQFPMFSVNGTLLPSLRGRDYDVVGMGRGYFDADGVTLEVFSSFGSDYGHYGMSMGTDREHLEEVTRHSRIKVKYRE